MREQRDDLKTELIIKRETEQKDLEKFQPGHVVENEKAFSKGKTKGVAEQLIGREINIDRRNHQDKGRKTLSAFQSLSPIAGPEL
jgi:hypothetical protein